MKKRIFALLLAAMLPLGAAIADEPLTDGTVLVEGVGVGHRNVKPSQLNPRGGKKDIHTTIDISKVALVVDEKTGQTSRVGLVQGADGGKTRVARALKNKEIK